MARHVLQLLGPSTGGIRLHVATLASELPPFGWDVSIAGPHGVMDDLATQDHRIDVPSLRQPFGTGAAKRQLAALFDDVDVLHVHGLKAARIALGVPSRPPTVLTVHNLVAGTQPRLLRPLLRRLESSVVARCDHLIVISDEIADRFADVLPSARQTFVLPASPTRRVEVGRDQVRASFGIGANARLVTVVARHHRQKNLPMFLRAIRRVSDDIPDVRALLVGDGPERSNLERLAEDMGLGDVVVFAGHRPNPADEMGAADVVALSSDWEGSPLVVAECLSLERPLVTTAVGTVTRHLEDRVDARITPIGDDAAFAAALTELLLDPTGAARLAAQGKVRAAVVFDHHRLIGQVSDVYERVLASPRRNRSG